MNLLEIAVAYELNYRRNKTFEMQVCRGELIACSLVDEWTDGLFIVSDAGRQNIFKATMHTTLDNSRHICTMHTRQISGAI